MNIAIISFTSSGLGIAERLKSKFENEGNIVKLINKETIDGKVSSEMSSCFRENDALIFVSSTGIAVRMIAPYVVSKVSDPAVVVVDDLGRYSISLLSGHIGGANDLSIAVAKEIGAEAVVTTASDGRNIDAVDTFAMRNSYEIDSMEDAKTLTQLMVEGRKIAVVSDAEEDLKYDNAVYISTDKLFNMKYEEVSGIIIVSSSLKVKEGLISEIGYDLRNKICRLIPQDLYIGMGCRRNTPSGQLKEFAEEVFERHGLDIRAVKAVGSIDIKQDEFGLIELAEELKAEFRVFTKDELLEFESLFPGSEFVKKTVGVSSVSQTSAYKMTRNIIVDIEKRDGITITIGKKR